MFHYRFEIKDEKWYRITIGVFEESNNPQIELPIISESEIPIIKKAVAMIYKMSNNSNKEFTSFSERLDFLKTKLQGIMTAPLDPLPESVESDGHDQSATASNVVPFRSPRSSGET
ncbi:MAG: hypothetical protein NTW69_00945 [Chloroflexi bacterium]|nr:hypothetical protein [Chloroflexota bacterium]